MRDALNEKTKIIYLDNPINPLGTKHSRKEFEDFVYSIPDGILIMCTGNLAIIEAAEPAAASFLNRGRSPCSAGCQQDTDGIAMKRGDEKAIISTIHKIGRQEGFGRLLRDGVLQAAKTLGKGAVVNHFPIRSGLDLHLHVVGVKT